MAQPARPLLSELITRHEKAILEDWLRLQSDAMSRRRDLVSDDDLARDAATFLAALRKAAASDADVRSRQWDEVREVLAELSDRRARLGLPPSDTASFVFSLKQPLFSRLRQELGTDAQALGDQVWAATSMVDALGLYTTEVAQKTREAVIVRQQQELLELSTPVVRLWEGVLGLPLIGTLDSARTQVVMESLLQQIVQTGASVAIIDITGVPTVDTLVAQHLLKTVAAARLMGADCIISGIRPQIAQTIVHLGVELGDVTTKASLADALAIALQRT
ncbi:MAG TPA: STAS domain-containing protein, partial [Vicinamibacteria bacterium]|nr:STAS domain-containing protein [Vicinamibacteria bacterium]